MPRNDIFCNYLNLKQKILSQPKNVKGDTWFLKIILEVSKQKRLKSPGLVNRACAPGERLLLLSRALTNCHVVIQLY